MKIFDCFMYFDEDVVLDVRLNTLNQYVNKFIIVESLFTHKGDKRDLKFDIKKFNKFENKIVYLVYENEPFEIESINEADTENEKSVKSILNAIHRENGQRNFISEGLKNAHDEDFILISDLDEIPNLKNINLNNFKEKLIFFNQEMFYYKFNLKLPNYNWVGTKSCKKKNFINAQWLRNIKDKNYPFYRLDLLFSKNKYRNIRFIKNGGWHFTNIKTSEEIRHKLSSYLHHREFDLNPLSTSEIEELIKNKKAIYDLSADKRSQKFGNGIELENYDIKKLPNYIYKNLDKFKNWIN
jgi:beta-1,4-mannosyl-glycoprotein beta-1,4-N-acetylglucosaminyltransferase